MLDDSGDEVEKVTGFAGPTTLGGGETATFESDRSSTSLQSVAEYELTIGDPLNPV